MGFALPSGVVNTDSVYFYADVTLKFGPYVKEPSDQTLVILDYSQLTSGVTIQNPPTFSIDVTSNPQLVVSYPQVHNLVVTFLVSGGIAGQQYQLSIATSSVRTDILTISIPSSGDCGCEFINPVPAVYTQIALGDPTQGYTNTALRMFWGNVPPSNPSVLDQWYDTSDDTLYEWVATGTGFFWDAIASPNDVQEAPTDGGIYGRYAGVWTKVPIQVDAPADAQYYGRSMNGWVVIPSNNLSDAPSDGTLYARLNKTWSAAYPASNPSGFQTAGQISSTLANYYLASNPNNYQTAIQVSAAINPLMPKSGGLFTGDVTFQTHALFASPTNLVVNGGASGNVLSTNGAGVLSWLPFTPGIIDAPNDGQIYGRKSLAWTVVTLSVTVSDTPPSSPTAGMLWFDSATAQLYVWYNDGTSSQWVPAVNPGGGTSTGGIPEAPTDGQLYSRRGSDTSWQVSPGSGGGGIPDAPNDGTTYARKSLGWTHLTHNDITDWAASISQPATVAPLMNGIAAVGASALYARQDHIHPTDTSLYPVSNPSGYQTAAQVTTSLGPYALSSSVPAASTTTPVMDGTAAVGIGTTFARADHVHPTDTSRYAATNPSGYQTAAQVTTSLSSYLPLAGGTLTGNLIVQAPVDLKVQTVTQSGASLSINRSLGENCTLSLTASITSVTVSNWPASGITGKMRLVIVNTGAFTIAGWPTGTKWPGGTAPTITSSGTDIILLMTDNGGTTIYGSVVGQGYA